MTTWNLKFIRSEVKGQLENGLAGFPAPTGFQVFSYLPARINPPAVLIGAGDPYLEDLAPTTFQNISNPYKGKTTVRLELTLVAGVGDNEKTQNALDDLICKVIDNVRNWDIERVSQPFQLDTNGALYLSTRVVMTAEFTLEEV